MKSNILSQTLTVTIVSGSLLLAGTLAAQNPYPYKKPLPGSDYGKATPKPTASPEGKAAKGSKLSAADKAFMQKAAKGGMMEVEWGKLAAANAQNADVKKFGARMVADHSKANAELMKLAKEEGVQLPSGKKPGKWKSDKDYMDMMVKDHTETLADFQKEASEGSDPDLKKFADKTSKTVSKHLKMAQDLQGKVK